MIHRVLDFCRCVDDLSFSKTVNVENDWSGWWHMSVTEVAYESVWGNFNLSYLGLLVEISTHAQKNIFMFKGPNLLLLISVTLDRALNRLRLSFYSCKKRNNGT